MICSSRWVVSSAGSLAARLSFFVPTLFGVVTACICPWEEGTLFCTVDGVPQGELLQLLTWIFEAPGPHGIVLYSLSLSLITSAWRAQRRSSAHLAL